MNDLSALFAGLADRVAESDAAERLARASRPQRPAFATLADAIGETLAAFTPAEPEPDYDYTHGYWHEPEPA